MSVGAARPRQLTKSIDGEGYTTYVATYEVIVTTADESMDDVTLASGISGWGETLSFGQTVNSNAVCIGKTGAYTDLDGTNLKRVVTCTFSTKPGGRARSNNNVVQDPRDEPWKISGSYVQGTRVARSDLDGVPIMNSAEQPKGIETFDGYDTLNLEGPTASISIPTRAQARFHCNSAIIWDLTPRQLLMAQWQFDVLFHRDTPYPYHRLEFWIKYAGWNDDFIDIGTRELINAGETDPDKRYRNIRVLDEPSGAHFLDGTGMLADLSVLPDGFLMPCKIIPEFDFTTLGFPNPLPGPFI